MKVYVYRNLHKNCFSIRAMEGPQKGKVIAHRTFIDLTDATFKVSEKGRQRVLSTGQKNVHAGIVGQWDDKFSNIGDMVPVRYNPKESGEFRRLDGTPVQSSPSVSLTHGKYIFAEV